MTPSLAIPAPRLPVTKPRPAARWMVAGVGNLLMADDGVGIHAIQELQRDAAEFEGVEFVEIGTGILHGISIVEEAQRLLVLDAVHGGGPPGTLYEFEAASVETLPSGASIHALGLRQALRCLGRGHMPAITILGVEPAEIRYSMNLSSVVQAALPQLLGRVRQTLSRWLQEHTELTLPLFS